MELVAKAGAIFCALSYLALAGLALAGRKRANHIWWLIAASGLTVLWALGLFLETRAFVAFYGSALLTLEVLRGYAWIGFLAALSGLSDGNTIRSARAREGLDGWLKGLILIGVTLPGLAIAGGVAVEVFPSLYGFQSLSTFLSGTAMMLLLVVGLLLLENLYRNAGADQRWGTRYLCLGISLFFVYDFFFYAESLLFKRFDIELADARPYVTGVAGPLIALSLARVRFWAFDLHVSRQVVFHSATLVGAGTYLIAMSVVGYWIRQFGGEAGPAFQVAFLALAGVMLLAILASGSLRSRLKLFIARHFYSSKYDYREEWLRFITTLGSGEESSSIAQRIVWAVAPIVDSTAAALWVMDRAAGVLRPVVSWNYGDSLRSLEPDDPFVKSVRDASSIVVLDEPSQSMMADTLLPDWIKAQRDTWLVLPLVYRGRLNGILLLGQPRAPRSLDYEDRNLLTTVASQAASYLAEDRAAGALAEARKMEEFNQRFTFVAHDLKNIVNQLSILVSNARRHGDNPDFQKDAIRTVANSVDRMNGMMKNLTTRSEEQAGTGGIETLDIPTFDLVGALRDFASDWQAQGAQLRFEADCDTLCITAKRDVLISALNHMVQNAIDASGPASLVRVLLVRGEKSFTIEVVDNGPGMEPDFIENVFFQPFGTTREGGYGIGGFQIRSQIRDLGARLEVFSTPGQGTTIRATFLMESFIAGESHPSSSVERT